MRKRTVCRGLRVVVPSHYGGEPMVYVVTGKSCFAGHEAKSLLAMYSQETYTGHYNPESQEGARKSKGMLQRGFSNLENNHRWQGADTNQGRLSAYQGLVAKVDDILTQLNTPTLTVEYAQAAQEDPWISWSKGIQGLADPDEPETTDS